MLKLPRVYPILDTESLERRGVSVTVAAAAFLDGGAGILQIRHKAHWSRDLFAVSREVARLCREAGALLIINDRADFAALLEAGLHVGQDDLSARDARRLLGTGAIIGLSSHSATQLAHAAGEPVDYLAVGPIFATASKARPDAVVGIDEIRRCRGLTEKPLVAIGGITLETAGDVWSAGADSVAVIAGMIPAQASSRALRERMEAWGRAAALPLRRISNGPPGAP